MIDDRITVEERYCSATHSSNLTPRTKGVTDADVLLAAGIAASGDAEMRLALSLYRIGVTGDLSSLPGLMLELDRWLIDQLRAERRRRKSTAIMGHEARRRMLGRTLNWWFDPTCRACDGRRWLVAPGTGRLSRLACHECGAAGRRSIAQDLPAAQVEIGRQIAGRLDVLVSHIHDRMAWLLSSRMTL